ncbi:MAG: DUF4238 domain-containing protein [Candidatus Neomarinimicrobiota bacterium]
MVNKPKKQHYVARSYLKGFSKEYLKPMRNQNNNEFYLWYYDIERNEYRKQHIKEVAQQRYFYSWITENGTRNYSLEEHLSEIECAIYPLICDINTVSTGLQSRKQKTGQVTISQNERDWLIEYIRIMMVRVPSTINTIRDSLIDELSAFTQENVNSSSELIKHDSLMVAFEMGTKDNKFLDILRERELWVFYPADQQTSFITTDRPVTRFNKLNPDGIIYDNTEIYIPLTQNCLLMVTGVEKNKNLLRFTSINDRSLIRRMNRYLASFATKIVIGRDKTLLISIVKNLQFDKQPKYIEGKYKF